MNEKRRARTELWKQSTTDRQARFYDRRQWRDGVAPAQLRREPLCRTCSLAGKYTVATEVDHVIPLTQGGEPFDPINLQSLCHDHHSQKTRAEQLGKEAKPHIKGADASGMPIDPEHPWNK